MHLRVKITIMPWSFPSGDADDSYVDTLDWECYL
jgi:hypothetical protein